MLNEHDLKDFVSKDFERTVKQDVDSAKIIRNAIETPDGTVLDSKDRWDFVSHTDRITGEFYFTDGGLDYFRRSINKIPAKDLSVTTLDPFEVQRQFFQWTSLTKDAAGKLIKQTRTLQQLTDDHISAILRTQLQLAGTCVEQLMKQELEYGKSLRKETA